MNEQAEPEVQQQPGQIQNGMERVWGEIKQISKQVERETRRSGRVARLHLDLRGLRRQQDEVQARLGKAVFEAQRAHGDSIEVNQVEGYAGGIAALETLDEQIVAKEAEIEVLRGDGTAEAAVEVEVEESIMEAEEVAAEDENG